MSVHAVARIEVKHAVPENIAAQALDWALTRRFGA